MKNGIPEASDGVVLRDIYKKLNIDGILKEPLSIHEMVILFCVGNYVAEHFERVKE